MFAVLSMHRPYSSDAGVNSDVPQIIAQDSTTSTEISKFSAAADVATDMVDYITLTHPALLTYAIKAGVLLVLAKYVFPTVIKKLHRNFQAETYVVYEKCLTEAMMDTPTPFAVYFPISAISIVGFAELQVF